MDTPLDPTAAANFQKIAVEAADRHVFLCVGPDCCSSKEGLQTWDVLKAALKERKSCVLRTKAACLRVCSQGPWMLVYPEGVWYKQVDPERCRRIVEQHLVSGRPVEEWVVKRHPLAGDAPRADETTTG